MSYLPAGYMATGYLPTGYFPAEEPEAPNYVYLTPARLAPMLTPARLK